MGKGRPLPLQGACPEAHADQGSGAGATRWNRAPRWLWTPRQDLSSSLSGVCTRENALQALGRAPHGLSSASGGCGAEPQSGALQEGAGRPGHPPSEGHRETRLEGQTVTAKVKERLEPLGTPQSEEGRASGRA